MAASSTVGGAATVLHTLAMNAPFVGISWVVSSAILTTYSTTKFLKYDPSDTMKPLRTRPRLLQSLLQSKDATGPNTPTRTTDQSQAPAQSSRKISRSHLIPRPTLLTLYRFSGSLLLGLLVHVDFWHVANRIRETLQMVPHFFVPAILLFVANFCNSISLDRIGISLTYTSKCGIPLITVLLTFLLDGANALPNPLALLSLLPIAVGIAAASWSAPSFELLGFLAAMLSTTAQSALNVSSKHAIAKTGVAGPEAQRVMVAIGLVITVILTAGQSLLKQLSQDHHPTTDATTKISSSTPSKSASSHPPLWLSLMTVSAYHVEYVLSFMFVRLVQPITYGTCDAVRRLAIIMTGRAFFGGAKLTHVNMIGIGLALMGALSYSVTSHM